LPKSVPGKAAISMREPRVLFTLLGDTTDAAIDATFPPVGFWTSCSER